MPAGKKSTFKAAPGLHYAGKLVKRGPGGRIVGPRTMPPESLRPCAPGLGIPESEPT